jgi:hypothetical protein
MMSYTASPAWTRLVLSLCCTEHDSYCGAVWSGRITSVSMSRSGQLGRRCTIEPHCSGMHVLQAIRQHTSVPWKHVTLAACLGQLSLYLFMWSTTHRELWDTWQHRSSPLRKAEPQAVGHVAAPELPSQEGRARSHRIRGSTGAHLIKDTRSEAEGHVAALELTLARRRGLGPRNTWWRQSPPLQGGVI